MPNVEIKHSINRIKIMINELVFFCIERDELIAFQAKIEHNKKYIIEWYTRDRTIVSEIESLELWTSILEKLDSILE